MERIRSFEFRVTYRSGKSNANADALSRLTVEDENTNVAHEEDEQVVINAIHLTESPMNMDQLEDADIKWMYDLKRQAEEEKLYKITVDKFDNDERRTLYLQWDRIRISGKNLYREWFDENDNINLQLIIPKKHRKYMMEQAHSSI
jgi:predicted DNA-binding WGR domain protein